jgi:hypothetical protein
VGIGTRRPAGFVPRRLAAQACDLAVHAQRIQFDGLGARHQLHRSVELQVDIGGVVDEEIADRSPPGPVSEAAFAGHVQAGLARQRVGANGVIRRRAVERGVELRERALVHAQARDGDVRVGNSLPPPIEVDVGGEFLDGEGTAGDAIAFRRQLDDRRFRRAADAPARMQLAACAFGQQRQVIRIDTESEVDGALGSEIPVDRETGVAGAKAQRIEGPVLAMQRDAAASTCGTATKFAGEIADGEVEIAVGAKRGAARPHIEIERAIEARTQLARVESLDAALERPAFRGTPARFAREQRLAVERAEIQLVDLQVILVERAAHGDRHGIELRNDEIAARRDGVGPEALEAVFAFGAGEDLRRLGREARRQRPTQSAPRAVQK